MPVFELIQLAVNALLLLRIHRLLAERRTAGRERRAREARLEGLAAELCGVAEAIGRVRGRPARPAEPMAAPDPSETQAPGPPPAATSRRDQAEGWLARGLAVEAVAARLDMPEGEVELLRNLRRPPAEPGSRAPQGAAGRRRAAPAAKATEARGGRSRRSPRIAETAPCA